jgi:hypothetical protein
VREEPRERIKEHYIEKYGLEKGGKKYVLIHTK